MFKQYWFALAVALLIEIVNIWVLPFPLDTGIAPNAGCFAHMWAFQWIVLNYIGLRVTSYFLFAGKSLPFVLFLFGSAETFPIIAAVIYFFQKLWARASI